jgi:hypothetical protein
VRAGLDASGVCACVAAEMKNRHATVSIMDPSLMAVPFLLAPYVLFHAIGKRYAVLHCRTTGLLLDDDTNVTC